MEYSLFWEYIFIQISIVVRTNEETSSRKHKSKSKRTPILQRRGSKDSLSGQYNQPAYVEQLLKLKEKKRSVINFNLWTQEVWYIYKCYQDITFVTTSTDYLIFIRNIMKKKIAAKHNSTDKTDGIMCESREHTGRYFRQSQSSKVNK